MPQPDAATVAETLALVRAQAQARQEIADITQAAVRFEVASFAGWYASPEITAWAARMAKITRASQRQTATSTSSYTLRLVRLLTGRRSPASRIDVNDLWAGVPLESVYGRLADNYRYLQATRGPQAPAEARISPETGRPLEVLTEPEILDRVLQRAEAQTDEALTLAMRDQWAADLEDVTAITHYRRIIHPEVPTGASDREGKAPPEPCGLCVVIADRTYLKAELLPVHTFCRCTVAPIVGEPGGEGDPGLSLNEADLKRIYGLGGGTQARNLAKVKVAIHEHGELGPVLRYAKQAFKDAGQAKADTTH